MATEVIRYVDPSSAGGNGTTNALSGANAAYVSLNTWQTAEVKNLVTADEFHRVICCTNGSGNPAASAAFSITGWTTDATRYVSIESEKNHGGKYNTKTFRIEVTSGTPLDVSNNYVKVIGMQVTNTITGPSGESYGVYAGTATAGAWIEFDRCIIRGICSGGGILSLGMYLGNGCATSVRIKNSIVYGWINGAKAGCSGIMHWASTGQCYIYNTTVYNCLSGIGTGLGSNVSNFHLKNVGIAACTTAITGTPNENITGSTSTPTFKNAAGGDFHLLQSDTTWRKQGTDLTSDATYPVTTDVDNVNRPSGAGTWDIGADQYGPRNRSPLPGWSI